jgi:hypothetical protein
MNILKLQFSNKVTRITGRSITTKKCLTYAIKFTLQLFRHGARHGNTNTVNRKSGVLVLEKYDSV